MATKIDIPGTDNSLDPMDLSGSAKTLVTTILGFGIAAMAASIGVRLWNRISQSSEQLNEIEVL